MKHIGHWVNSIFVLCAVLLFAGCVQSGPPATLKGKVSVGPLTPVERVPEAGTTPTPIPAIVFTSRSINIYQADGKTLVKKVAFQGDGTYQVELAPGTYVVNTAPEKIERARDLPKTIQLHPGETVELDIDIDTGIR